MEQINNELETLFDKKNIKTLKEWDASIRTDLQYKDATDSFINALYNKLAQPIGFYYNLRPLIEANIIKERAGVPNYKDLADFEDVLNNSFYVPLGGIDPMVNTKLIYNHLIKDKNRFINILNEYGLNLLSQCKLTKESTYNNISNKVLSYDLFTDTFFEEEDNNGDQIICCSSIGDSISTKN